MLPLLLHALGLGMPGASYCDIRTSRPPAYPAPALDRVGRGGLNIKVLVSVVLQVRLLVFLSLPNSHATSRVRGKG